MGPLSGVRVVELQGLAPVPFAGMILADLGADVVRVDRESGGVQAPPGPLDRGKRNIKVDLKSVEGVAAVHALAQQADVFVEGYRPGVAERLGIGPHDVMADNPGLIYARLTGWGQDGPFAQRAGHDINYVGIAGALDLIGSRPGPPVPPGAFVGDLSSGSMMTVIGILAALHERQTSGKGQTIDAAIIDGAALMTSFYHGLKASGMYPGGRGENLIDGGAPRYDTYETADGGYLAVGCIEPQFLTALVTKLELDITDPTELFASGHGLLRQTLTKRFLEKSRDEWAELFADSDACVTPVLSPWEAHEHPHNMARRSHVDVGGLRQPAPAPRFGDSRLRDPQPMQTTDVADILNSWSDGK